jgi:hypothetical protein
VDGENHDKHSWGSQRAPTTRKTKNLLIKAYRRAYGNKEKNLLKLGEISPLGLSKLSSKFGSIERVFGLSNAERIGNLKVDR